MIAYLKTLPARLFAACCRVPIKTLVEDAKYQAQRDLLTADFNAEHWTMQADMLRGRIARLDKQLGATL